MTQFDWDGETDDGEVRKLVALKTSWEQ